ncbi:peptidoglycan editing factor PgeF [Leptolyngbya sp. FACHB-17]|uniref:peptidoglycan editing factor PgeF n=1 Tax=unclassified Leptolyngbya TaxID=2650499 RepID=UPI00168033C4|nr:peptidoglycan editing factor PgeF [Leptolyngbya sp. FACHB-17]MBD2081187.1 peptidoglycan editing factor PgeF [Leptolyngbya sp. FACHB-17]
MHTWHWQTWNDLPYLTCSLLEPWQHGFFTQQFSPRSPFELTEVLDPAAEIYRVHQVHGNVVLLPSELENPHDRKNFAQADGLMTEQSQQAVWACSADCTPALIGDVKTGNAAAVHAGWRGTAQKIVPVAIEKLRSQGSRLEDLRIALGPAISGEVYQVSHQVALEVGATIEPSPDLDRLISLPNSPILRDSTEGRSRLDVRRVIAIQLERMGMTAEQIAIAPHCTYQDPINFFSYRREKLKKVQWSGIVSREADCG